MAAQASACCTSQEALARCRWTGHGMARSALARSRRSGGLPARSGKAHAVGLHEPSRALDLDLSEGFVSDGGIFFPH